MRSQGGGLPIISYSVNEMLNPTQVSETGWGEPGERTQSSADDFCHQRTTTTAGEKIKQREARKGRLSLSLFPHNTGALVVSITVVIYLPQNPRLSFPR